MHANATLTPLMRAKLVQHSRASGACFASSVINSFPSVSSGQSSSSSNPACPAAARRGQAGTAFLSDNWQHCRSLDDARSPVRSFYGPAGLVLSRLQTNETVCAVIANTVTASREIVLLRFALSSMASLSY